MSSFPEFEYHSLIRFDDPIVRDHRVHGVRIMPGVVFLDLIYRLFTAEGLAAGELVLKRVLFKEPVAVDEGRDRAIAVAMDAAGDLVARSRPVDAEGAPLGDWDENMACRVDWAPPLPEESLDIDAVKRAAVETRDMDSVYAFARKLDIRHLDFMKGLGALYLGEDEILAEIHLGEEARDQLGDFYLHPAYLDAATFIPFQSLHVEGEGLKPFIPLYIEQFRAVGDRPLARCFAYARKPRGAAMDQDVKHNDLALYDQEGRLLARFDKLTAKRIRARELITRLAGVDPPRAESARAQPARVKPAADEAAGDQRPLEVWLRALIGRIVDREPGEIPPDAAFYEMGLESTDLLEIASQLEQAMSISLYPTLLFERPNPRALADFLLQEHPDACASLTAMEPPAAPPSEPAETPAGDEPLYFRPAWRRAPLPDVAEPPFRGDVVLFDEDDALRDGLAELTVGRVALVKPGKAFRAKDDDVFAIDPKSASDYRDLLEALADRGFALDAFLHCWSRKSFVGTEVALRAHLRKGVFSALYLAQALMARRLPGRARLMFVHFRHRGQTQPQYAAVSGFLRTLALERPDLRAAALELDEAQPAQILAELARAGEFAEVRRLDGDRWVRAFEALAPEPAETPFRAGGVCLITGGLGGLGLIFARFLAERHGARLALVGRAPLDEDKRARLDELTALGGEAAYFQADVSDRKQTMALIDQVKERFGALHGVIHAAGVVEDGLIAKKTAAEVDAVLAAKVFGSIYLDEETKDEDLDWFLFCSSASALFGNHGQSDYAFANGFMDRFAGLREAWRESGRRSGKTLSINWPLWRDGGMGVSEAAARALARQTGIAPLTAEAGLDALARALAGPAHQVLAVAGDPQKIRAFVRAAEGGEAVREADIRPAPDRGARDDAPAGHPGDVAVIGLAGRYPMAPDLGAFWANLVAGRDCIVEVPADRWDWRPRFDAARKPGKIYAKWGGFLDEVDRFDPRFFNITPREAEIMDPQERLFLQTAWHVLEDAGYGKTALAGRPVGVFAGVMWSEYQLFGAEELAKGHVVTPSASFASIANRVSYFFNFTGPSLALDTMCSSSLTALHLACAAIQRGECELALAGGVNLSLHPAKYHFLSYARMASSDGRCRAFGEGGDGYTPGEGVGAALLKPLDRALADGDRVYAVIKGSALNHGGKSGGYSVPNPTGQGDAIRAALTGSGVDPKSIGYVEAHGTGTSLGDPIEIAGLERAFADVDEPVGGVAVGSVKSNIGHLESAAGIAGFTKTVLQLQRGVLAPSLHARTLNPRIDFKRSKFRVQQEAALWPEPVGGGPRCAGISSFGAGGANVHLILEEWPVPERAAAETRPRVFAFSAVDRDRLRDQAAAARDFLTGPDAAPNLADAAYTLARRDPMAARLAVVAVDADDLARGLDGWLKGDGRDAVVGGEHGAALAEMAQSWASGGKADGLRAQDQSARFCDWPGYVFARDRCWIEQAPPAPTAAAERLRPLLDRNVSQFDQIAFETRFDAAHWALRDHRVGGEMWLPGAAYVEMAAAAGELAAGRPVRAVRDIVWAKPFRVDDGGDGRVRLALSRRGDEASFEAVDERGAALARGTLSWRAEPEPEPLDLAAIRGRSERALDHDALYRTFAEIGFEYGPAFRVMRKLWIGRDEALAELRAPEDFGSGEMALHPGLLDGALRATLGLAKEGEPRLRAPFALGEARLARPLTRRCFAYAARAGGEGGMERAHIQVVDETGQSLVHMRDFAVRDVARHPHPGNEPGQTVHFYQATWQARGLGQGTALEANTVLVIGDPAIWSEALTRELADSRLIWASPAARFARLENGSFAIHPASPDDYRRLLEDLAKRGLKPDAALHLLDVADPPADDGSVGAHERVSSALGRGLYSALGLFQAWARVFGDAPLRAVYASGAEAHGPTPHAAALSGLGRSLTALQRSWVLVHVAVDPARLSPPESAALLVGELRSGERESGAEVWLRDGSRLARCFEPAEPALAAAPLRKRGVYLVSGGCGVLGFALAKRLATRQQARLVLTGRSPEDSAQERLAELASLGAEAVYVRGDVAKRGDAERAARTARDRFGALHGVFHVAGVAGRRALTESDRETFDEALVPKLWGALQLDRATQEDALDLFALFGSVSSWLGDFGAGSYAAANRFFEAFAESREQLRRQGLRRGVARALVWPLWRESGLDMPADALAHYRQTTGLEPLETDAALDALEQSWSFERAAIVPLAGDRSRIERVFAIDRPELPEREEQPNLADEPLLAATIEYLKQALAKVAKMEPTRVDPETSLESHGVDSVMIMELSERLEGDLPDLPRTMFFERDSLREAAVFLVERYGETLRALLGLPSGGKSAAPLDAAAPAAGGDAEEAFLRALLADVARGAVSPEEAMAREENMAL